MPRTTEARRSASLLRKCHRKLNPAVHAVSEVVAYRPAAIALATLRAMPRGKEPKVTIAQTAAPYPATFHRLRLICGATKQYPTRDVRRTMCSPHSS